MPKYTVRTPSGLWTIRSLDNCGGVPLYLPSATVIGRSKRGGRFQQLGAPKCTTAVNKLGMTDCDKGVPGGLLPGQFCISYGCRQCHLRVAVACKGTTRQPHGKSMSSHRHSKGGACLGSTDRSQRGGPQRKVFRPETVSGRPLQFPTGAQPIASTCHT